MKSFILLALIVGCASESKKLTDKAKELEVYGTKPTGCSAVGKVVGEDEMGSKDVALNHALNQAADLGDVTGIFVNQEVPNGKTMKVFATAYECK